MNAPYAAGDRIAGRYVVEELLGRGGMGIVMRALDDRLQRAVALKVLPSSARLDGIARARMLREARSAAALNHPGIVQIYDVGDTGDGGSFIAMELVRGRSLRDAAREGWLDLGTLARIGIDIGATLSAAHREGLVHRDVKPDNVMLRADGRVVVLDFGLAKPVTRPTDASAPESMALTDDGSIVGTPAYLSPEQARGEALTGASDQFSLAVALFEMLTGRLPWSGNTPTSVLASMLIDEPARIAELMPSIPPGIDAVFARGLAKTSTDRYPDCEALGRAFAEALGDPHVDLGLRDTAASATPISTARRSGPHAPAVSPAPPSTTLAAPPPRRVPYVAIGATALLAIGALGWRFWPPRASEDAPVTAVAPLALDTRSVLACPLLQEQRGGSEKGWLAAAISTSVCERARWMLGGSVDRTRIPAELLGLSTSTDERAPDEHGASDVFVGGDARARTLDEASRVGTAWLDGTFARHGREVEVHALLRRGDEPPTAEVDARGTVREVAVAITDAWARAGVLPPTPPPIDDEVARWTLVPEGELALARFDADQAYWLMEEAPLACATLAAHGAELAPIVRATIQGCEGIEAAPVEDVSSPPRMAMTALSSPAPRVDLVPALDRARTSERSSIGLATLAAAQARSQSVVDRDRTIEILLVASTTFPRGGRDIWPLLAFTSLDTAVGPSVNRAYSEWRPLDPDAWATGALPLQAQDPRRIELLRRAHAVGPRNTSVAADLAFAQIDAGSVAAARSVAAQIADAGPDQRFVSELISVVATSAEGRIGAAMERARALIASLDTLFTYRRQDYYLATWVAELTLLTGDRSLADLYLGRALVERSSGRIEGGSPTSHDTYLALLALVGTPELGRRVIAQLEARDPLVEGVRARLAGDDETAARLLRQLLTTPETLGASVTVAALADLLEARGGAELVARADEALGDARGPFHGVGMLDVRRARRHAARGEHAEARASAQRVIDALAESDLDLPILIELRRLTAE